jgi:hypothetical protein
MTSRPALGAPPRPGPKINMPPTNLTRIRAGMWAALLAYGLLLSYLVGAVAGGSDTSGYFNEARLFSHFEIHTPIRAIPGLPANAAPPYLYVPLGFRPSVDGSARLVPTYPAGLAVMLVPLSWAIGWHHSGNVLLVLHSLAGLVLTYRLGRNFGLSRAWSFAGATALAASPLYLFMSLWAMSDVPALVWAAAAVVASRKCRETASWAVTAGLCAAIGFLLRPSNFLVVLPMLILIGFSPKRLLLATLGGLPGIFAWIAINHAAYGSYWESGYGAIGNEFHQRLIPGTLRFCVMWLPLVLSPLVILSPAIVAFFSARTRVALALAAWGTAYVAFYAPYRWTDEAWWFLRFLLPAAPAFLIAGLIVVQSAFEFLRGRIPERVRIGLFSVLFLSSLAVASLQIKPLHAWYIGRGEEKYRHVADWLKPHLPQNAVVISSQFSGSSFYYTPYILVRSDELNPGAVRQVRDAVHASKRPIYAVTFPFEQDYMKLLPGKWVFFGKVDDISVWKGDWDSQGG